MKLTQPGEDEEVRVETKDITGDRDRTNDLCPPELLEYVTHLSRASMFVIGEALQIMLDMPIDKLKISDEVYPYLQHWVLIDRRLSKLRKDTTGHYEEKEHDYFLAWLGHTIQECLPLLNSQLIQPESARAGEIHYSARFGSLHLNLQGTPQ